MKKIHSRRKKKLGLKTHLSHKPKILGLKRKYRPKTFKTEQSAREYAKKLNLKDYKLKKVKKGKKFQIVKH